MNKRKRKFEQEEVINYSNIDLNELKSSFNNAVPFNHQRFNDFLNEPDYSKILSEIKQVNFTEKSTDLQTYQQQTDIKPGPIDNFKQNIYNDKFLDILSNLINLPLNKSENFNAYMYTKSQYLACHDDRVSNRAIAFIYQLSDEVFDESDGGTLDLYENVDGIPTSIKRKMTPTANTFVIFKVSRDSFHKVDEILSDKKRYSLTGWFHADEIKHPQLRLNDRKCFRFIEPIGGRDMDKGEGEEVGDKNDGFDGVEGKERGINDVKRNKLLFEEIILNPILLKKDNIEKMTEVIMNNCIIEINDFLLNESQTYLKKVIKDVEQQNQSDPMILQQKIFKSKQRQQLINSLNNCKIGQFLSIKEQIESLCMLKLKELKYADIFKISHRSFAMAVDQRQKYNIELHFQQFILEKKWNEEFGGTIHYLNNDENLWNIIPKNNSAVIVLLDNHETYDILKQTNITSQDSGKQYMIKLIQEVDEEIEDENKEVYNKEFENNN